ADVRGAATGHDAFLELMFVGADGLDHRVATRLVGAYNLPNALAAIAVGRHFHVPDTAMAHALAAYEPGNNRSQFKDSGRNHLVLDAYNANPSSMAVALRNFAAMPGDRPKRAILGDMLELGASSAAEHRRIVELAAELGVAAWFVGREFAAAAPPAAHWPDGAHLLEHLAGRPLSGHLVLVKGSRGIGLETVAAAL
ncbi:MAG: cyanophycin synthetase, partial [Flavobacteriales bacterium]|nr:cyanophycin synthetase [Flavobacteriales bacterium]